MYALMRRFSPIFPTIIVTLLTAFTSASLASQNENWACMNALTERIYTIYGQSIPLHFLEEVPPGEEEAIEDTNRIFAEFFQEMYLKHGEASRRGVHPKSHGSLVGHMIISSDLDSTDQVGIFQPGRTYQVQARFSNANPRSNPDDSLADSRGIGLKVLGVDGDPLLPNIAGADGFSQDFTMNSTDTFFSDTAETYRRFMEIGLLETTSFDAAAKKYVLELFKSFRLPLGFRVLSALKKIQNANVINPLNADYFSIAPFQHGVGPAAPLVKYAIKPCNPLNEQDIGEASGTNFLRENLTSYISRNTACFRFMVQDYLNSSFAVEDLTVPWSESASPFRELARIYFPAQGLVDDLIAERQIFNPWNTLPAHKPVGGISRLRLAAYLKSIEMRQKGRP